MNSRDREGYVAVHCAIGYILATSMQRMIWFIRHGESKSNAGLATCDPILIDLTSTGYEQAIKVANACWEAPSKVIVSQYQRTRQTALPTLKRFALVPEVWDVHEFTYLAQLHGQMTTKQERRRYVDAYWRNSRPESVASDGSESFVDFFLRVQCVVNQLLSSRERFTMVFSHEQFITAARWILSSGRTFSSADINVDMMTGFRHALNEYPIPNGAILPVLIQNSRYWCGGIITSHLGDSLCSKELDGS